MCSLSFTEWGHALFSWTGIHAVFHGLVFILYFVDLCSCCFMHLCSYHVLWACVHAVFHGLVFTPCFMDLCSCCVSWTCGVHKETGSCAQTHSLFFSFLRHYCIFVSSFFSTQNWFLIQFRARGLPDDHEGPVRVLDIEGVDATLCCGTHVSNLSHLQVMKSCRIYQGSGLSLVGAATSIIFVATKVLCLSQQKYACRNKTYVAAKLRLSRQTCVCHNKTFVSITVCLSHCVTVPLCACLYVYLSHCVPVPSLLESDTTVVEHWDWNTVGWLL